MKIRIGLSATGEQAEACRDLTATFDAGRVSTVRTPRLDLAAPSTTPSLACRDVPQVEMRQYVVPDTPEQTDGADTAKVEEPDFQEACEKEAASLNFPGEEVQARGLIQIDSSSGSSSDSTDSSI